MKFWLEDCDGLGTCPGYTLTLAHCYLGLVKAPPRPLQGKVFIIRNGWLVGWMDSG